MVTCLFSCKQMKKIFFSLVMLLISMTAKSEIWYYLESGLSPEGNDGYVYVVIKDNSGQLWMHKELIGTLKQCLLDNQNHYIDAFNTGSHMSAGSYDFVYEAFSKPKYFEDRIFNYKLKVYFSKLTILERTKKSYVVEDKYSSYTKYAISFDFGTMIKDCDKVNPLYYTSIPVDRFIVRRSIDDLF